MRNSYLFQQKYTKCGVTQGIMGISIYVFFTVNYSMTFSISKIVNLTVFYSKITLNVP